MQIASPQVETSRERCAFYYVTNVVLPRRGRYLCFVLYRFLMDGLGSRAIWLMKYDTSVIVDLYCIVNKVASKIICEISSNLRDLKLNYCDFDQG